VKSVPRGKAIWNANGGFVSVLLTHLFELTAKFFLKNHPRHLAAKCPSHKSHRKRGQAVEHGDCDYSL